MWHGKNVRKEENKNILKVPEHFIPLLPLRAARVLCLEQSPIRPSMFEGNAQTFFRPNCIFIIT